MKTGSLTDKVTYKRLAIMMTIFFVISLLPIIYCSFFDYANGDDLWEGAAAYRVLANNGSLKEFVSAVFEWAKVDYYGWEGNWSSIILWCLEPSIWGEKVYCITPYIALIAICGGTIYFLNYFLKKTLACDNVFITIISIIVCFFSIQYMPYVKSGIFWYTGMINYVFPYGLSLASFVWLDKFVHTGKWRYFLFSSLFYAYLGGAGYIPIVFAFEVMLMFIVFGLWKRERIEKIRTLFLLIPVAFLVIGFAFSALSPGNAVRGGESYYFDIMRVFRTIIECIWQGFLNGANNFLTVRTLILIIPLIMIVTWEKIDTDKIQFSLELKYVLSTLVVLFLISCSVYAPGIYAQSEVSGGVPDTIFFIFLLTGILAVIYITCYLKKYCLTKNYKHFNENSLKKIRSMIFLGEILICIFAGKYFVGNMSAYICYQYISSGQLKDFEFQMQERLEILHNPEITNVVLPEMNDQQGPFMHMPIIDDPECYTNQATARFYGKESVIAIPRTEYYELYGYPEGEEEK